MLKKIISGGQTGADRAALDAALALEFPCGGWCPKGRRAEDGIIPSKYPLQEIDNTNYALRTIRNVADSDGTLIVASKWPSKTPGTKFTVMTAKEQRKPCCVIVRKEPVLSQETVEKIIDWCTAKAIGILNVAGTRSSKDPTVYEKTRELIDALIRNTARRNSSHST